jgi:NADH:ubiquinone oxidoreductase subunit D
MLDLLVKTLTMSDVQQIQQMVILALLGGIFIPVRRSLDYVSMMTQEHAFCIAIESLLKTVSYTSLYVQIRVLFDELTRILNHLLAISTHSLDVGNMSPML